MVWLNLSDFILVHLCHPLMEGTQEVIHLRWLSHECSAFITQKDFSHFYHSAFRSFVPQCKSFSLRRAIFWFDNITVLFFKQQSHRTLFQTSHIPLVSILTWICEIRLIYTCDYVTVLGTSDQLSAILSMYILSFVFLVG